MLFRIWESVNSYNFDERMLGFLAQLSVMHVDPSVSDPGFIGCREEHRLKDRAMCRIFVHIHVNGQIARNPSKPSATALSMNAVNSLTGAYPIVITQPHSEVCCQSPLIVLSLPVF